MKTAIALALGLAACAADQAPAGPTLPSDAHFTGLPGAPYSSPEDCLASDPVPFSCLYELSLCHNGRVGLRIGDLISEGTYHLEGAVAVGDVDGGPFHFEVDTATGTGVVDLAWEPDTAGRWMTLQWDTIDCTRSTI